MTKKYIAYRDLSINVKLGKVSKHISFTPLTLSGSVFYTDDAELQEALEKHPYCGSMFYTEEVEEQFPQKEEPKSELKERMVTCVGDAGDILSDEYGISRTKIRTIDAIKKVAEEVGINFIGL